MKYPLILVDVPHRGEPVAWTCYDPADLYRAADRSLPGRCRDWYSVSNAIWLLASMDGMWDGDDCPLLVEIGSGHVASLQSLAPDTLVYRADYLLGDGVYTLEMPDQEEAALACLRSDLSSLYVVEQGMVVDEIAILTGPDAPRIGQCGPVLVAIAIAKAAGKLGWTAA